METERAFLALARGRPWQELVRICLSQLDGLAGHANVGIVFMSDPAGEMADDILFHLRAETGIDIWVGAAGRGILAGSCEIDGEAGLAVLLLHLPPARLRIIEAGSPLAGVAGGLALLHLASDMPLPPPVAGVGPTCVGGRVSTRFDGSEIARITSAGGCSGLWLDPAVRHVVEIFRGGQVTGPWRRITSAIGGRILALDEAPATERIAFDAGELLAREPDKLVRRLAVEIHPGEEPASSGGRLYRLEEFRRACGEIRIDASRTGNWLRVMHRNPAMALEEIDTRVAGMLARFPGDERPRAAICYSSVDRGHELFGPSVSEAALFQAALGPVPLIGLRTIEELHEGQPCCATAILVLIG